MFHEQSADKTFIDSARINEKYSWKIFISTQKRNKICRSYEKYKTRKQLDFVLHFFNLFYLSM